MRVAELMTLDPVTVAPAATVAEARVIAEGLGVHHLPVVDGRVLVGMLTERELWNDAADVLRAVAGFRASKGSPQDRAVRSVMQSAYPTVRPELTVQTAAQLLLLKERTGVAVVDTRSRLVGILTVSDLRRVQVRDGAGEQEPGLRLVDG